MRRFGSKLAAGILTFGLCVSVASAGEPDKKTVRTWKAKCAACHGNDGKGDTEKGKKMGIHDYTAAAWQSDMTDAKMKEAIQNGVKRERNGKKQEMDPFKDKLKPDEVDALVALVRGLKK